MSRIESPKRESTSFGDRLASLRKAAGLSQRQLATATGSSQRMIAYYEGRDALPPGKALAAFADALETTVDELVGKKAPAKSRSAASPASRRLLRRLRQMEKLPLKDKRELLSIIDTYLEKHRLSQKST